MKEIPSSVEIGGYNSEYIDGDIQYLETYSDNFWAPVANGMYYDGIVVDPIRATPSKEMLSIGEYKKAVFDTGTAYMALSEKIMNNLYSQWEKAIAKKNCPGFKLSEKEGGIFLIECKCETVVDEFKELDVVVNGHTRITVTPYGYLREPSRPDLKDKYCFVAITSMPASLNNIEMYLLGNTFMRHFYTIYDYNKTSEDPPTRRVGLAPNAQYVKDGYDK